LTPEQIDRYEIPTAPPKSTDSRAAAWQGGTAQAEALTPSVLASEVRRALERWIDPEIVTSHREAEAAERIALAGALPRGEA
jgi:hypothetical protein